MEPKKNPEISLEKKKGEEPGEYIPIDDENATTFDVSAVNIEENGETKSKLIGDVDFENCSKIANAITPVRCLEMMG